MEQCLLESFAKAKGLKVFRGGHTFNAGGGVYRAALCGCSKGVPVDEEGGSQQHGSPPPYDRQQWSAFDRLAPAPVLEEFRKRPHDSLPARQVLRQPNPTSRLKRLLASRGRVSSIYAAWVIPGEMNAAVLDRYKTLKHNMLGGVNQ